MQFSFDFQAPKYFDFSKKYPEKSPLTQLDPLNENDAFFLNPKESVAKQSPPDVPLKDVPSDKSVTEINKAPESDAVSKKETIKDIDLNTKKTLNQDPIQQEKKESIQRPRLTIPKDVPTQIKCILTQKKEVNNKVQLKQKPILENRPIEQIKPPSTNIFSPAYLPNQITNIFAQKNPSPKTTNIFATGNLPTNTTNVFAQKAQEKPVTIPRPSIYPFGQKPNQSESTEPVVAVNRQPLPLTNFFGNYGTSNVVGTSNLMNMPASFGVNIPQENQGRSNLSLNTQPKNPFVSNNQHRQVNRSFSAAGIHSNQPPAQKRPQPCLFPIRIQREWEEAHGRKWYQLQSHEIPAAEESMRKRLNRQNGANFGLKSNISSNNAPCMFPIRIQREWEEAHGRKWSQLRTYEIPAAEESMRKRLNRQNGANLGSKPNIVGNNTNQNQTEQQRYNFSNPFHKDYGKGKPFKF